MLERTCPLTRCISLLVLLVHHGLVRALIRPLNFLDKAVDSLRLCLPLLFRHLLLPFEHPGLGHSVCTPQTIKGSKELSVVDLKTRVVQRVTSSTIDNRVVGHILAIVNQDGPEVDEHEKNHVRHFLQREDEWEDMVGQ